MPGSDSSQDWILSSAWALAETVGGLEGYGPGWTCRQAATASPAGTDSGLVKQQALNDEDHLPTNNHLIYYLQEDSKVRNELRRKAIDRLTTVIYDEAAKDPADHETLLGTLTTLYDIHTIPKTEKSILGDLMMDLFTPVSLICGFADAKDCAVMAASNRLLDYMVVICSAREVFVLAVEALHAISDDENASNETGPDFRLALAFTMFRLRSSLGRIRSAKISAFVEDLAYQLTRLADHAASAFSRADQLHIQVAQELTSADPVEAYQQACATSKGANCETASNHIAETLADVLLLREAVRFLDLLVQLSTDEKRSLADRGRTRSVLVKHLETSQLPYLVASLPLTHCWFLTATTERGYRLPEPPPSAAEHSLGLGWQVSHWLEHRAELAVVLITHVLLADKGAVGLPTPDLSYLSLVAMSQWILEEGRDSLTSTTDWATMDVPTLDRLWVRLRTLLTRAAVDTLEDLNTIEERFWHGLIAKLSEGTMRWGSIALEYILLLIHLQLRHRTMNHINVLGLDGLNRTLLDISIGSGSANQRLAAFWLLESTLATLSAEAQFTILHCWYQWTRVEEERTVTAWPYPDEPGPEPTTPAFCLACQLPYRGRPLLRVAIVKLISGLVARMDIHLFSSVLFLADSTAYSLLCGIFDLAHWTPSAGGPQGPLTAPDMARVTGDAYLACHLPAISHAMNLLLLLIMRSRHSSAVQPCLAFYRDHARPGFIEPTSAIFNKTAQETMDKCDTSAQVLPHLDGEVAMVRYQLDRVIDLSDGLFTSPPS